MGEKLLLTNDLVFQRIFGKVGNENITRGFLERLLGIKIASLSLNENKRMQGERLDNKTSNRYKRISYKMAIKRGKALG